MESGNSQINEGATGSLKLPPNVSGEKPDLGHMEEFSVNFARFLMRCNEECGELAEFNMGGQQTVLNPKGSRFWIGELVQIIPENIYCGITNMFTLCQFAKIGLSIPSLSAVFNLKLIRFEAYILFGS
ncbi:MAG: hypothetical protein AB8B86_16260 [Pseudomonadales bacterium]